MATEYDLLRCMLICEEKRGETMSRRLVKFVKHRSISVSCFFARILPTWKPAGKRR